MYSRWIKYWVKCEVSCELKIEDGSKSSDHSGRCFLLLLPPMKRGEVLADYWLFTDWKTLSDYTKKTNIYIELQRKFKWKSININEIMEQINQSDYEDWLMRDHTTNWKEGGGVCGNYRSNKQLLLLSPFCSCFSCTSFTSFSTSHASSSSSSVWGVWSHSQKCLKLPSSSGAEFSTSVHFGLSLPRLLRRWGGSFGGGGRGGTLEVALAGLCVSGPGHRLMVPPPPLSSSLCDWLSSCFCCWDAQMDLGWRDIQKRTTVLQSSYCGEQDFKTRKSFVLKIFRQQIHWNK